MTGTPGVGGAGAPSPAEIRRLLARGAGRWHGSEQVQAGAGGAPAPATSRTHARLACGGALLLTDFRQEAGGEVVMEGHSVMTWAPSLQAVVMYFFDGSGEPPSVYRGGWEEDGALLLEGPGPGGSRIRHRTTHPAPDRMRTVSSISFDGGANWVEVFDGAYLRED